MSQDLTSFKPLKEFAREKLPQSSLLRQLILLEPDTLPRNQLAQKQSCTGKCSWKRCADSKPISAIVGFVLAQDRLGGG